MESEEFKNLCFYIENSFNNEKNMNYLKLSRLYQITKDFFNDIQTINNNSKVIIFTHNRNSALEIKKQLQLNKKIKCSEFIGQRTKNNKSNDNFLTQKKQIEILERFKEGNLNTLIATCIGEEGLDIGEVDLIICFDGGFSPIRMIQRIGRTGRKRDGKVFVLLMKGKEYYSFQSARVNSTNLKKELKLNCEFSKFNDFKNKDKMKKPLKFFSFNPRMIPEMIYPKLDLKDVRDEQVIEEKILYFDSEDYEDEEEKENNNCINENDNFFNKKVKSHCLINSIVNSNNEEKLSLEKKNKKIKRFSSLKKISSEEQNNNKENYVKELEKNYNETEKNIRDKYENNSNFIDYNGKNYSMEIPLSKNYNLNNNEGINFKNFEEKKINFEEKKLSSLHNYSIINKNISNFNHKDNLGKKIELLESNMKMFIKAFTNFKEKNYKEQHKNKYIKKIDNFNLEFKSIINEIIIDSSKESLNVKIEKKQENSNNEFYDEFDLKEIDRILSLNDNKKKRKSSNLNKIPNQNQNFKKQKFF